MKEKDEEDDEEGGAVEEDDECMMAVKRSVVGSGPILCPGKSRLSKERIKEVLPTEYCTRERNNR